MAKKKQIIGGEYLSRGRKLSLSRAVRAGDFVFLTGVVPRIFGKFGFAPCFKSNSMAGTSRALAARNSGVAPIVNI